MAGRDWLYGFLKRHPGLSFRTPEPTALSRLTGFNRVQMGRFYDNLETMMEKHEYPPKRVYNMDKTGFSTCASKKEKVLAKKVVKQVGKVDSAKEGETITGLCCFSAAGGHIPPCLIFKRKRMQPQLLAERSSFWLCRLCV